MNESRMNGNRENGGGQRGKSPAISHYSEAEPLFKQYEYTDEEMGVSIPYNLYLPDGYDESKNYPLVIYIADRGVNSDEVKDVLAQDGAVVWATQAEQEKHECIILAPQYTVELENAIGALTEDDYEWSDGLTLVSRLIFYIIDKYSVDENRIYGTGQSQGGMSTIAISDKYPDLYAGQLLVACQWNTDEMAVMKDDNLWIIVCEGDRKAYPGMNDAVAKWEALGTSVAKSDMWNLEASEEEFNALVVDVRSQNCNINYTVFAGGGHRETWQVAYTIEAVRDWLFEQEKN